MGPANYGGTGVIETPNARVMREGRFRFGAAQADPYRFYYGAVSPFSFLEIASRATVGLWCDVAQDIGHLTSLFNMIQSNKPVFLICKPGAELLF